MTSPWPVQFRLAVDHVHDGDTIYGVIYADAGLDTWIAFGVDGKAWGIRFYGINCPELNASDPAVRADAVACRDYLETLVHPGDTLNVASYSYDKYDKRIDGVPYLADGTNLCQAMLTFGHGTVTM